MLVHHLHRHRLPPSFLSSYRSVVRLCCRCSPRIFHSLSPNIIFFVCTSSSQLSSGCVFFVVADVCSCLSMPTKTKLRIEDSRCAMGLRAERCRRNSKSSRDEELNFHFGGGRCSVGTIYIPNTRQHKRKVSFFFKCEHLNSQCVVFDLNCFFYSNFMHENWRKNGMAGTRMRRARIALAKREKFSIENNHICGLGCHHTRAQNWRTAMMRAGNASRSHELKAMNTPVAYKFRR